MADVFLSYRNTPERRAYVRRLARILRAHEITVWWDHGLEAGDSYKSQILAEIANAEVVSPVWCEESVRSQWVQLEAKAGVNKLFPLCLQKVKPPEEFEAIQAADLSDWCGEVNHPRLQAMIRQLAARLHKTALAPADMLEELQRLPTLAPLDTMSGPPASFDTTYRERSALGWVLLASLGVLAIASRQMSLMYFFDQLVGIGGGAHIEFGMAGDLNLIWLATTVIGFPSLGWLGSVLVCSGEARLHVRQVFWAATLTAGLAGLIVWVVAFYFFVQWFAAIVPGSPAATSEWAFLYSFMLALPPIVAGACAIIIGRRMRHNGAKRLGLPN